MKKKKLLLPLAVMTLSCGLAAGILTGCGGHKHNFTEWDHDDSGHWQICLEDGEKSEKKNHVFGEDGKCECGVEKPKYGTASGQVKLWKMGQFVTDYAGVTLDTGEDDGTEIDFDTATGEFEITNARVGKSYTLTISKTGYLPYTTTLEVVEDENSVIGGSTGCVLNYEVFNSFLTDWDHASHSYAHANDAESYIDFATGGTFNPVTQDSYTEVAATLRVDWNNSTNNLHTQGIALIFANGKHAVVRYHNGDGNGNIQFADNAWDYKSDASVFKDSGLLNEWGEYAVHQLSDEERAAITDGDNPGMDLTVSLKGGKLYVSFDGKFVTAYTLPEDVQGQQAKIGYFSWNPKQNAKFYFDISQDIPSYPSTVELKKNVPDGATEVEIALDKGTYSLGDDVTLSVSLPAEGYIVSAITLNGKSILSSLQDGKLTFMALQEENELVVTVVERKYADVEIDVIGKKYDVKGNALEGKEITLKGQGGLEDVVLKVTNGKIAKTNVVQGTYTAQVEGYKSVEVVVGETGIGTSIALEYDGFTMLPPNYDANLHDFSQINDGIIKVNGSNNPGKSMDIVTKDSYGDVSVTINVKNSAGGVVQGIVLKFDDNKYVLFNFKVDQKLVQYRPDQWGMNSVFGNTWIEHAVSDSDIDKYNSASGVDLELVRKGGVLYEFVDGRYVGQAVLPEGYETKKAQVGFFSYDPKENASWAFEITETLPALASTVELEKNVPTDATGVNVALDKTECALGDIVTLTVTLPEEGYIVSVLTLNGESVLNRLSDGTLTFTAMQAENTVVVTVVERRYADVDVSVTGKKYDVTGNSIVNGTTVTLKGQGGLADVTFEVANGRIAKTQVVQGTYTAQITGYKSVENVVVGENGIETALVFEYEDAFDLVQGWGKKNLDQQNDGYLKGSNETESLLTKALYRDVAFTVYLSGAYSDNKIDGGNQGIAFRFDGGGYVLVRMEGKQKIQFARPETWWQKDDAAEGADWNDLIFFQSGDKYLKAYAEGTLKLTVVRRGVMFYAFLNDEYIGCQKVADKYAEVGAHVGIYWTGTTNGAYKSWKYEMSETLPSLASTVELTKEIPQGVDGIEITLDKTAYTFGDTVTLNIAGLPEEYIVSEITLNGQSIFGRLNEGTLTFPAMKAENTVVVTVVAKTYGNVDATISGKKRGEENDISLNGTKVKLSNDKYTTVKYEIMVGSDKIAMDHLLAGVYTLSAEGYVSQKITIAADGTYSTAITLVYNVFTAESASADLSKLNEGKVTATGNGGLSLVTKESYTDVTAEAVFDLVGDYATTQRRYSVGLAFGDGKVFRVDLDLHEDEVNAFTNVNFKLVRKGDKVTVYVNDQEIKTYTLPEGYATETAQVKFIFDSNGTDGTKGFTFDITVSE